jgi:hypothetical protein
MTMTRPLQIQPLTQDAFRPFGQVVEADPSTMRLIMIWSSCPCGWSAFRLVLDGKQALLAETPEDCIGCNSFKK